MNKNIIIIILIIWLFLLYIFIFSNNSKPNIEYKDRIDTLIINDTIRKVDSILINKPIVQYKEIIKIDTLYNNNGEKVELITENKIYNDTICKENDSIIIQSFITGQNATLDSIKADWRRYEITKTLEITKYIKSKPKITISPNISVGYGIFNKKPDVYVGIGLNYNF